MDRTPDEMFLGLSYLKQHHDETRKMYPRPKKVRRKDRKLLDEALHYGALAFAVYAEDEAGMDERMPEGSGLTFSESVKEWDQSSRLNKPGFMIVDDPNRKEIVLAVRGTDNLNDILTDVSAAAEPGYDSAVHSGFHAATVWFRKHRFKALKKMFKSRRGYSFRTVGHSLGGATAAMIALDFSQDLKVPVSSMVFAPAAGFAPDLSAAMASYVTSFVLHTDVVPRFSTCNTENLHQELKAFPWRKMWVQDQKKRGNRAVHALTPNFKLGKGGKDKKDDGGGKKKKGKKGKKEEKEIKKPTKRADCRKFIAKHGIQAMYPPGEVYSLSLMKGGGYMLRKVGHGDPVEAEFSHIELDDGMFDCHRMGNYIAAFEQAQDPSTPPPAPLHLAQGGSGGSSSGGGGSSSGGNSNSSSDDGDSDDGDSDDGSSNGGYGSSGTDSGSDSGSAYDDESGSEEYGSEGYDSDESESGDEYSSSS